MAEIPNMTRARAFMLGNLLRQGLVGHKREPVAYLYGEDKVRAPKLPVVEGCPYVFVYHYLPYKQARFLPSKPKAIPYGDKFAIIVDETLTTSCYALKDGEWVSSPKPNPEGSQTTVWSLVIWSNFDAVGDDGTVYLAATEPIPVYE